MLLSYLKSFKLHPLKAGFLAFFSLFLILSPVSGFALPECMSILSDSDGDGYGYENNSSCLVTENTGSDPLSCIDSDGDGWGWNGVSSCQVETSNSSSSSTSSSGVADCIDTDGDGWGWNGVDSCLVDAVSSSSSSTSSSASSSYNCYDDNNDGWGWDGQSGCRVSPSNIPYSEIVSGVTDVVLMAGQSNALGENTSVDYFGEDAPNSRVIVWTEFNGWKIADLCSQAWDKGFYPWTNGNCSNHPGFQIAKHIVELDPTRKVAFIPTGEGSRSITWWDVGSEEMDTIDSKVESALADLQNSPQVDFIAWSQGESDSGEEDWWIAKLYDLIERFRSRDWFDASSGIFIAQETSNSTINDRVIDLRTDGDPLTDWIEAQGLATADGVHWTGGALREIGARFADRYLSLK